MANAVGIVLVSLLQIGAFASPVLVDDGLPIKSGNFQWQIYKACDPNHKATIIKAWEDSIRFADALKSWKPKEDYQAAMEMYMGDRCTYEDFLGYNFPKQIQDTARRRRGLHDGVSEYGDAKLWVYCNEDSNWWHHCEESNTGTILAYEQEDVYFNNWYITICPSFYNKKWLLPLDTIIKNIKDKDLDPQILENWAFSQAGTFFHETMHLSQLVTSPVAYDGDQTYGPKLVYDLARSKNTDAAVYVADSWSMAALAIFAQKEFNLKDPPYPKDYPPAGVSVGNVGDMASLDIPQFLLSIIEKVTGFVPEGSGGKEPFHVDPNIWDVYPNNEPEPTPPPPPPSPSPPPPPPPPTEPEKNCPEPYPGWQNAPDLPRWAEKNKCKDVCPGGKIDFCAGPANGGGCQCTDQKCIDEGRYYCMEN